MAALRLISDRSGLLAIGMALGAVGGFAWGRLASQAEAGPIGASPVIASGTAAESGEATAEEMAEFEKAVTRAGELSDAGEFAAAYDHLLAASRLAPSDARLFDAVLSFVESAWRGPEDDQILADDLYARAEMLIPYQPVDRLPEARKRFLEAAPELPSPEAGTPEPPILDPLDEAERLVRMAEDESQQTDLRLKAASAARAEIDEISLSARPEADGNPLPSPDRLKTMTVRIDAVEQSAVEALYQNAKGAADGWLKRSAAKLSEAGKEDSKTLPQIMDDLKGLIEEGAGIQRELLPYTEATGDAAKEVVRAVEARIEKMQRERTWIYNLQTLRLLREVESHESWTPMQRLGFIAHIQEEILAPYVLRRHTGVWDKYFEELEEGDKAKAVKLRILKSQKREP